MSTKQKKGIEYLSSKVSSRQLLDIKHPANNFISKVRYYDYYQEVHQNFAETPSLLVSEVFVRSPEVKVMNRNILTREINQDLSSLANRLTIFEINQIYHDLSRFAVVDAQTKQAHIDAMQ